MTKKKSQVIVLSGVLFLLLVCITTGIIHMESTKNRDGANMFRISMIYSNRLSTESFTEIANSPIPIGLKEYLLRHNDSIYFTDPDTGLDGLYNGHGFYFPNDPEGIALNYQKTFESKRIIVVDELLGELTWEK